MRSCPWLLVAIATGCAQHDRPIPRHGVPRYAVTCSEQGLIEVQIALSPGSSSRWEWKHGHERIEGLETEPEAAFEATASGVKLAKRVRVLRYRYRIGDGTHPTTGVGGNGTFVVSAAAYLLRPRDGNGAEFIVQGPAALPWGSGSLDKPVRVSQAELERGGLHCFGVREVLVERGAGQLSLTALRGEDPWNREVLEAWAGDALSDLQQVFPSHAVDPARVVVLPRTGAGIGSAIRARGTPPSLAIPVGGATLDFSKDWLLLRELCRSVLPEVEPGAAWIREGAATYLQHLAAVRSSRYTLEEALQRLRQGATRAKVLAGRDSLRLLGRDPSTEPAYAAAYWGGALLMLDLDLRLLRAGKRVETLLGTLADRPPLASVDFAAEVDAMGGAGLFAELEAAHLVGPFGEAAEPVFSKLGLDPQGGLLPTGAKLRAALVRPPE